jgi:hypothetical protein
MAQTKAQPRPKNTADKAKGDGATEGTRKKVDWDAVERDYRTGKFTDGELSTKYGVTREAIVRRRKREQEKDGTRWAQDLEPQVRAATNALLIQEHITAQVTDGHTKVTGVILAAAELNKSVILKHRSRLEQLNRDADAARDKLIQLADGIVDIREAATYVSALEASARTAKIVIEAERKAYNLDEKDEPDEAAGGVRSLTDAERAVRLFGLLTKGAK